AVGVQLTRPVASMVRPAGPAGRAKVSGTLPSGSAATTWYRYASPTVATNGGGEVTSGAWLGANDRSIMYSCVATPPWPSSTRTLISGFGLRKSGGVQRITPVASITRPGGGWETRVNVNGSPSGSVAPTA